MARGPGDKETRRRPRTAFDRLGFQGERDLALLFLYEHVQVFPFGRYRGEDLAADPKRGVGEMRLFRHRRQ